MIDSVEKENNSSTKIVSSNFEISDVDGQIISVNIDKQQDIKENNKNKSQTDVDKKQVWACFI